MENTKIDITSSVAEKGIDLAKSFIDKLIMPAIEETGLLLKEQVARFRFNNQIRMINKAHLVCERNNISPKTISLKLLCPLLDYSGLEEDEVLQDKWAILLSNMVDSEQNIENHVFPYILSQLSSNEFLVLEKVFNEKLARVEILNQELEEFRKSKPEEERELQDKLLKIDEEITELKKTKSAYSSEVWDLQKTKREIESKIHTLKYREGRILGKILKPETVPYDSLKEFEFSNAIRLGIVKEEKEFYANSQTLEIPNERDEYSSYTNIDLNIDVESDTENILTELGELFISACKEKNSKA